MIILGSHFERNFWIKRKHKWLLCFPRKNFKNVHSCRPLWNNQENRNIYLWWPFEKIERKNVIKCWTLIVLIGWIIFTSFHSGEINPPFFDILETRICWRALAKVIFQRLHLHQMKAHMLLLCVIRVLFRFIMDRFPHSSTQHDKMTTFF